MGTTTNPKITGVPVETVINITDTNLPDHGNPSQSGTIANAIRQINLAATAEERKGKIVLSAGVFTITTKIFVEDSIRLEGGGVDVTVLNFQDTAGGIEVRNADFHSSSRVNVVGDYLYPSTVEWPFATRLRCIIAGTSGTTSAFSTLALANPNVGDTFDEVGGVRWEAVANVSPYVGDFSFSMISTMTGEGIRASRCNGVTLGDFFASGGNTTAKNITMQVDSCNKFQIGKLDFEISCNGLLFNIENLTVLPFNFGDGNVSNVDVTLLSTGTYGVKFLGSAVVGETNTINNILVNRIEVVGSGTVASVQTGIWFEGAQRNTIKHYDCEQINVGIMEIGTAVISSSDNTVSEYHFLPNTGDQTTEGYPWARGLPFQTPSTTNEVIVREGWLDIFPFSNFPTVANSYIADDEGIFNRDVNNVNAAVGGLITLDITGNIPASGGSLSRYPVLTPNTNLTINTSLKCGSSALGGLTQMPGRAIRFVMESGRNYLAPILYAASDSIVDLRIVIGTAGLLKFHNKGAVTYVPLASAPSDAEAGTVAMSDGTGSGFDGASGAGLYVRNAADSAWVFLG